MDPQAVFLNLIKLNQQEHTGSQWIINRSPSYSYWILSLFKNNICLSMKKEQIGSKNSYSIEEPYEEISSRTVL